MTSRPGRVRRAIAGVAQRMAWRLSDPSDAWVVDYRHDGARASRVIHGRYSTARSFAREYRGRIVGHNATTIALKEPPHAD